MWVPLTVKEDLVSRKGLVSKLSICCTECHEETFFSNPFGSETKSLNAISVLAAREIGRGQSNLAHFLG